MQNVKTNAVAILKVLGAIAYVVFKQVHGVALTDVDVGIVTLAIGGAVGNFVGADSKKAEPK